MEKARSGVCMCLKPSPSSNCLWGEWAHNTNTVGQVTNGGVEDKLLPLEVLHRGGWEGEGMGAVCMPSTSAPEDHNTLPLPSHKHRELQ